MNYGGVSEKVQEVTIRLDRETRQVHTASTTPARCALGALSPILTGLPHLLYCFNNTRR